MIDLIKKIQDFKITRRSFIGWTSAVAATAAIPVGRGLIANAEAQLANEGLEGEGVWKTAACWHNCGGRCLNKVLVQGGVVVRQKTDDTHEDSVDYPQQRGCLRGRSQRQQIFGPDRLKYPMKRKNWEPGGGKKELRGQDEWVRISWDEALDYVADETNRIVNQYGNEAIWASGSGEHVKMLSKFGGCVRDWRTSSYGGWLTTSPYIGSSEGYSIPPVNDRYDLLNSQLIVLWGANPAWSSPGMPMNNYWQAKKAGAKFIVIDPKYTDAANMFDADWVPVRPGTDDALILAIMHVLIKEDDPMTNPLIDWDVLNRCTVGFDADHMPEGAAREDNLKDYVLGTYDGQAKSPEWAAEICGVDAAMIRNVARQIGSTKRVALLTGWAPARINNAEGVVQGFMTLGYMTGNIGRKGSMTGLSVHSFAANGGPDLVVPGGAGLPAVENPVNISVNLAEIYSAIKAGKYVSNGDGEKPLNIKMIYHEFQSLNGQIGLMDAIEVHRNMDFVVANAYVLTTHAKYADIVLPITTEWEREGGLLSGNREMLIVHSKIVDPLYEAKHDQWVAAELLKRLGKDPNEVYPISEKQQFFNKLAGTTVMKEDGSEYEPLLTITQKDINEWGVDGTPQTGRITLNDFINTGIYQVKRSKNDHYGYIAYENFIKDPEANPLTTETGKFEIYSKSLNEASKKLWSEVPPIPKYLPKAKGYEDTFKNWDNKEKGEYPFQLVNPHYLRRSHSTLDNVPYLREAWSNAVYLNKKDAQSLGINEGDTVLITSEYGKTLRPATLTETLMPGVVSLPHGPWVDMNEKDQIDKAGSENILTGSFATGLGTEGYNTQIVKVEKWKGEKLQPDVELPQRVINYL
ncbi:molybdopterin-dependent oxidoreductase [Bacillus sp. B15-48]|uniref:molybdopterin-dependent oxidoreductase n=1 Tax=Bacillus sp. B15-48 TaxID=1548601 RepID=UPI00193F0310|nr:molybdopterin-dependent oxidoreductase [Bacillus sp. B15-48]MBM4761286.1 molybdopterin-dependent oxidoreductase [Bacillus sp. B15-48]